MHESFMQRVTTSGRQRMRVTTSGNEDVVYACNHFPSLWASSRASTANVRDQHRSRAAAPTSTSAVMRGTDGRRLRGGRRLEPLELDGERLARAPLHDEHGDVHRQVEYDHQQRAVGHFAADARPRVASHYESRIVRATHRAIAR